MDKHPTDQLPARSRDMSQRRRHDKRGSGGMPHDICAISTVIAAMLIFGLLITVAAVVNVHYIPSWVKDDEAKHVRSVFTDFSKIPGSINGLALANETDTMSKQRIKLGGGNIPILSPGKSWGSLGVVPQEANFTVKADAWMVNITGNIANGTLMMREYVNITNISDISSFYINIPTKSGTFMGNGELVIKFTNQSGRVEIRSGKDKGNHCYLQISTWGMDGNKIVDGMHISKDAYPGPHGPDYHRIDLLNPCYGFSEVLRDADTPYNLTVLANHPGGPPNGKPVVNYNITYDKYNRSLVHYSATSNGTLIYESMNRYFLNQKFIYQNGAVFLCQPPSASMRTLPTITIANTTNESASITIPMITVGIGINRTPIISGSGVEELQMRLDYADRITFADGNNTDNVSIIIEPPEGSREFRKNYLQEWADYFNTLVKDALVEGTLTGAKHDWSSDDNYTNVNVTLSGKIHLELKDIEIEGKIATVT
ncbi:MAG: hypothetical protein U9N12_07525 [Euryarchaeota archaeon]|nr:hypothetical protein [Euryarchaeota archaeon]